MNDEWQTVTVRPDGNIKNIYIDSSLTVGKPQSFVRIKDEGQAEGETFLVRRSNNPLTIRFQQDSIFKTALIYPRSSSQFLANALYTFGTGFIFDWNNSGRYAYPDPIYLAGLDTIAVMSARPVALLHDAKTGAPVVTQFRPTPKRTLHLALSIPEINSFFLNTTEGKRTTSGFFGLSVGLEYFYKSNGYISAYAGWAVDFMLPLPAPVDVYSGTYDLSSTVYYSFRNNHIFDNLDFGYGLSFSTLHWNAAIIRKKECLFLSK